MKMVFDENFFDEIDHFHPNFDESVPDRLQCNIPCFRSCAGCCSELHVFVPN